MSQNKIFLVFHGLVFFGLIFSVPVFAQSKGGGSGSHDLWQRASNRETKRWTLQEWLEQRDRNRMMDIWLQLNSPSPYELMLGVWQNSYSSDTTNPTATQKYISTQGSCSAYAQIFGLTLEYENNGKENYNDVSGLFDLRLAGNSVQNSNLTLHIGQRTRSLSALVPAPAIKNIFAEASLSLHLSKVFGVTGNYRYYQPNYDSDLNQSIGGQLTEAGAFLDFKALRVFGKWYQDIQTNSDNAGNLVNSTTRTGIRSGIIVFF